MTDTSLERWAKDHTQHIARRRIGACIECKEYVCEDCGIGHALDCALGKPL